MGQLKRLQPAAEASVLSEDLQTYDLKTVRSPRLVGWLLRAFVWLVDSWLFPPVRAILERANGLPQILGETEIPERPLFAPVHALSDTNLVSGDTGLETSATKAGIAFNTAGVAREHAKHDSQLHWSAAQLSSAYTSGAVTPTQVAESILQYVAHSQQSEPAMNYFIAIDTQAVRTQAAQSTIRYQERKVLSALDGVPYAVKDMCDALPYQTTCGTTYMASRHKAVQDHPMVAAMQVCGAILLGKTNMHELGVSPLGLNMHYGITRNPHNPDCFAGGSSSGSAAVVAAGLCPFAIGNDGGGSIRVPAACCGVVGLKPTWGRDCAGGGPKGVNSLVSTGPIAATVADALLMYAVIANAGEQHIGPVAPVSLPPSLADGSEAHPMHGYRIGVFWDWFNDAAPEVVDCCKSALNLLCAKGAEIVPISIPDLDAARVSHMYTFGSEAASCHMQALQSPQLKHQLAADVRITLGIAKSFKAQQFIQAQRIRARMVTYMEKAFGAVDFIATPTIPDVAPAIKPDVLQAGESDLSTVGQLMRFVFLSNFTGHPAISLPAGHNSQGLPIGLQLIGRPWAEAGLLYAGSVLEKAVQGSVKRPKLLCTIVGSAS